MAQARKYAGLPDLDSAPDIYETNDASYDGSTVAASTARSGSPSGSDAQNDDISRQHLHPSQARSHFLPARIDATDVDFSDRITSQRRSYRASWRRLRRGDSEAVELGDFGDDEDETLHQKLSRLRRETREALEEVERRKTQREQDGAGEKDDPSLTEEEQGMAALCETMEETRKAYEGLDPSATVELEKQLARSKALDGRSAAQQSTREPLPSASTQSSLPTATTTINPSAALAKAASFDARLSLLENSLGLLSSATSPTNPLSDPNAPVPKPVLSTLSALEQQLATLSDASLDAAARRVRQLTAEAEALDAARSAAAAAATNRDSTASRPASPPSGAAAAGPEDRSRTAQIRALYGALQTVEDMAPTLPVVLERLRALRLVHAGAGQASAALARLEEKQADVEAELRLWRAGVEAVEKGVRGGEEVLRGNVRGLEELVRGLERRLQALGG